MVEEIISILDSGGWVMYPLALSLIYTNGIELVIFLSKGNIQLGRDTEWLQWVYSPESNDGEIIRSHRKT